MDLIEPVNWMSLATDVKGTIYEELLQRSAVESPKGAGQYFTPRPVIQAIVDVMRPGPGESVCDPAAGTGGFLLAAHRFVADHHGAEMDRPQKRYVKEELVEGMELVPNTARSCAMNLYLHGIGGERHGDPWPRNTSREARPCLALERRRVDGTRRRAEGRRRSPRCLRQSPLDASCPTRHSARLCYPGPPDRRNR